MRNVFDQYTQPENRVTHALACTLAAEPVLLRDFVRRVVGIKPAAGMESMTMDMGGAGVVSGVMKTLALRKARANVVGVVGLVENMPDGRAQRPGDVVKSMKGDTVTRRSALRPRIGTTLTPGATSSPASEIDWPSPS